MTTSRKTRTEIARPGELPAGTLVQAFFGAIDRYDKPDAILYKAGGVWQRVSHREIERQVRLATLALGGLGLERGDRLAILSENRPEWTLADYAALCAGCLTVPIYATLPPDQIAYILNNSAARLIFVSTVEQLEKIRAIRDQLPALEHIVAFDDAAGAPDAITWREFLEIGQREEDAGRGADFRERALSTTPDNVATVIYTSGTTGEPKGVLLTHNNIYSNVQAALIAFRVGPEDVGLSLLPLSHIFERMVDYLYFACGATIAYAESIEAVPRNLVEIRPTIVASVPRLYEKIYERVQAATGIRRALVQWATRVGLRHGEARLAGRQPQLGTRLAYAIADRLVFSKLRARTGGRIRFFVSGGAPLNQEIARFFHAAGILLLEGYGLTETSPVTNVNTPEAFRFGTVGLPVTGTEIRIADDGEILIRGPQVMKGYYNDPAATAEAIDEDGWFHTGDIGELDEDGFLRITDRKKDLIVTAGGKNVAPQPIENRVKTNPFVAEAVMIGDRRPYPILLITPHFETLRAWAREAGITAADTEALVRDPRVREHMEREVLGMVAGFARFEQPKRIALLDRPFTIDSGELTPTLKVRRRVVEERYRDMIEALYGEVAQVPAQ